MSLQKSIEKKYYTTPELARRLGVAERTLNEWAYQRKSPPFIKPGRARLYPIESTHQWEENQVVHCGVS